MSHSQAQYSNLGLREVSVACFGVGGARISRRSQRRRVIDFSSCLNADVVVLHIGENDYEEISAETAAREIYDLALSLIRRYSVR